MEPGKKLDLISKLIAIKDDSTLDRVASIIEQEKHAAKQAQDLSEFYGMWTDAEAEEVKKIIEDSCEQINPDDWK